VWLYVSLYVWLFVMLYVWLYVMLLVSLVAVRLSACLCECVCVCECVSAPFRITYGVCMCSVHARSLSRITLPALIPPSPPPGSETMELTPSHLVPLVLPPPCIDIV
jgi:hypothetical protein